MAPVWVDHNGWVEGDMEVYQQLPWPSIMCCPPGTTRRGKMGYAWRGVYKIPETYPMAKENGWGYRCPAPMCFLNLSFKTEAAAIKMRDTHQCPWFGGGHTVLSWSVMSMQYVEPIWEKLDAVMNLIRAEGFDDRPLPEKNKTLGEARAYAESLAILMPPFFSTWKEIAREANRRYEARIKGDDEYCTMGIGRLRWAKPPAAQVLNHAGFIPTLPPAGEFNPAERSAGPRHNLTEEQVAKIREGNKAGFPVEALATAFDVSVNVIKHLVKN